MNDLIRLPLEGEILTNEDTIRVFIALGPLKNEQKCLYIRAGYTVRDIIQIARDEIDSLYPVETYNVRIGDKAWPIPQKWWDYVRPRPNQTLVLRPIPQGFITGLFAAVSGIFSAISGTAIGSLLLNAAIGIGVSWLVGQLFQPKQSKISQSEPKISYSLVGSRNSTAQWEAIPLLLGTHRITPSYGAIPYTERVGFDQWLRMIFAPCYGPVDLSAVKAGESLLSAFEDTTVQLKAGYTGDPNTTLYPANVVEEPLTITLLVADGWVRRTTATGTTFIQVELLWPEGLVWFGSKGERFQMGGGVFWRYRLVGAGSWTNAPTFFWTMNTPDTLRQTLGVDVATGQYEVELMKNGETVDISDPAVRNTLQWIALRGIRTGEPITFEKNLAVIAVRMRGSGQLNGVLDTLNCMGTLRLTAWNGSSWVANQVSSNPANLFRYLLQCQANEGRVTDSEIDLVSLQQWWSYCNTEGFTYNKLVIAPIAVLELLHEIAAAGRGIPTNKDGKWSIVWNDPNAPVVQMFTADNSWGFEAEHNYDHPPHAYRVRFVNSAKGYIEDERIVYDDGYNADGSAGLTKATRFEVLELPGIVTAALAWRHARFYIAQRRLRPAQYTLFTDYEGLILLPNDRVYVNHDQLFVGLGSGRVTGTAAQQVTTDETLTLSSVESYQFRFRRDDGTWLVRKVVSGTGGMLKVFPLQASDSPNTLPDIGDLFTFGRLDEDSGTYRCLEIVPQENNVHKLMLVDDAPGVSLADNGTIPDWDAGVAIPVDPITLPPQDLTITDGVFEEDGAYWGYLYVTWRLPRLGKVREIQLEYRDEGNGLWRSVPALSPTTTSHQIRRIEPGLYTVRARAIFVDGTWSAWTTSSIYDANAMTEAPGDVDNFHISTMGEGSTLTWDPILGQGITYQVRHVSLLNPTVSWNNATPLFQNISGTTIQMPTMIGHYLIKAVSPTGVVSVNAAQITTSIGSLVGINVVETLEEGPAWTGMRTNVKIVDNELRLRTHNTIDKWASLSSIISMAEGDGDPDTDGMFIEGSYKFPANNGYVDMGEIITARISSLIDAYGFADSAAMSNWVKLSDVSALSEDEPTDWEVYLLYQSTNEDPISGTWTAWQQLTVGDVEFRAIRFDLILKGKRVEDITLDYSLSTPSVSRCMVEIDMPDRTYGQENLAVGVGGLTVVFNPAFKALKGLGVAGLDLAPGDHYNVPIAQQTPQGFFIEFKDDAGVNIAKSFNFVAWGYGRVTP